MVLDTVPILKVALYKQAATLSGGQAANAGFGARPNV